MIRKICPLIPVILLWVNLIYGFTLDISNSLSQVEFVLPVNGISVLPYINFSWLHINFSWLQVLTNGLMLVFITYSFYILARLNEAVCIKRYWYLYLHRIFGISIILVCSLPSWWPWFWALWDTAHGYHVIMLTNKFSLMTAILMPYPAMLCIWLLWRRQVQKKQNLQNQPGFEEDQEENVTDNQNIQQKPSQ